MIGRHTPRRGLLRGRSAPLFLLAHAMLLVALGRSAAAQGTSGQFPDPVSSQDLLIILDRYVKPDPGQWTAIERFHDTYKTEFAALREGEIDKFLQDARSLQGRMPSTKQMEDYIKRMDRINDRIRTLDNRLFDQVQTVLRDDQIVVMPRVRLARERQVYTSSMMSRALSGGGRTSDLSQIVSTLDLSPEEAAVVDMQCAPYEAQLTRAAGKLRDATMRMFADLVAALEAAGFGDMGPEDMASDPDRMQRMMEVIKEAYAAVGRRTAERAADIVDINRRSLRSFMAALPEAQARKLHRTFVAEAYPQIQQPDPSVESSLRAAIRSTMLTEDQRAAAEAMLRSFLAADDSITDKMMDLADRTRAGATPFDFDPGAMEAQQKAMQELVEERRKSLESFRTQAEALLGTDIMNRLLAEASAGEARGAAAEDILPVDAEASAQEVEQPRPRGPVPPPIGVAEIGDWTRRLALPAERKAILDALHGDYVEQWQREVAPFEGRITEAQQRIYLSGDPGKPFAPDESSVDAVYALRREAIEAANRVDAELLANVRGVVADESRDREMRLIELRRLLQVGQAEDAMAWLGFGRSESNEASLDPFEIVDKALHGSDGAMAEMILLDHADQLAATTRQLAEATRDAQRMQERLSIRMMAVQQDPDQPGTAAADWQRGTAEVVARIAEPAKARTDLVQAIFDTMCTSLPTDQSQVLRRAYNRAAFPTVYQDTRSAEPFLERARGLDDLTAEQRQSLDELASGYMAGWDELSGKMIAMTSAASPMGATDPEAWRKWQEQREQRNRIRFERDELSVRTVRRLQGLLTDAQQARLRGLDAYLKKPRNDQGFFD